MPDPPAQCSHCGSAIPEAVPEDLCPRCTFMAVTGMQPELSEKLGIHIPGLTILKEIGEGGFGMVYLANRTGAVTHKVAIKILKAGLDTRQILRRFEIEQKALSHLEHPNIARIYDSGETERGYPYFTMEYICLLYTSPSPRDQR